jgi:hypothetical protein
MVRKITMFLSALLWVCASTVLASAQTTSSPTEASVPVAYIYVSSAVNSSTNQINGYSAAANGALIPIPGSPFADSVNYLALNGSWLFGVEWGGANNLGNIFSYSIGSNGALSQKDTYTVPNGQAISILPDHTGATLYADANSGDANDFLALSIDQSTGFLTEAGDLSLGPGDDGPFVFIGNNEFAYTSFTYEFTGTILGAQRASDGALSLISNFSAPLPTAKSGEGYWPGRAAADPTNHLAIAVVPNASEKQVGPAQLATYTSESDGSLTTNSTWENMPSVLVGTINDYWMSPSGKFLAVGGSSGLQLFHFNGANPITKFTGLITKDAISQLFWDNSNHLYAISTNSGQVFVFTVTSKGVTQAPGSPHAITSPSNLIVLPK